MIRKDLKPLYKLTAKLTNIPIYKVESVIKDGQFKYIQSWMRDPEKPALYIRNLGTWEIKLRYVLGKLKGEYIPRLRKNPTNEHTLTKFRYWYNKRHQIINYLNSKKRGTTTNNEHPIRTTTDSNAN
tara:strand:+ start:214 stop:594 length:381 start_codon:yes stop_codon:yes gene_type:complete